jgi:FkbM family methyltransferase
MHALARVTGRDAAQRLLAKVADTAHYLMGIGAGTDAAASGERVVIDRLRRLKDGDRPLCVFDVGANRGQFLDLVLRDLGDTPARVHAFEPSSAAFRALAERFGRHPAVVLNHAGLGRAPGTAVLHSDQAGSGLASLYRRNLAHFGIEFKDAEEVVIDSADEYCRRAGVDRVDLLKLDVEGHELDVLRGADGLFAGRRVRMVTFEFGGCDIDSRTFFQDFWYFFRDRGMGRVYRITPSGYLAPIRDYREADEQFRTTNYLVLPDEG